MDAFREIDVMKNVDVRSIDPATLVDIRDISVNTSLPRQERLLDYLRQIKNPYCFKHGKTIIKVKFADTVATLEDQLENFLSSL